MRRAAAAAVLAGAIAALCSWLGPPGRDLAAHAYQLNVFVDHGFALWDNFWYAGRYSFVTYSLVYYPLAAVLGISLLAVVSVAAAAFGFSLVAGREWGENARVPTLAFAVVWPSIVFSAAFPFALGVACGLFALAALQRGLRLWFAALAGLTLAASPPAFLLLGVVLVAAAAGRRTIIRRNLLPTAALGAIVLVELVLHRLFPSSWHFPFPAGEFALLCAFCVSGAVLTAGVPRARVLHALFLVYLFAAAVVFVVPSGIGENVARLRFAAIPLTLLAVSLRNWRPLAVSWVALVVAGTWNLSPLAASVVRDGSDPTSQAAFWRPVIDFLDRHSSPSYRVEVVDTKGHWGAVYLPRAGVAVARGWFRQDDFPFNRILYERFDPSAYRVWLRELGVRYVVLPHAPRDYSARREERLLLSGRSGLRVVSRLPRVTIFELPDAAPIVTGPHPARVVELTQTRVRLRVGGRGIYRIAIRSSPYWHASRGCVRGADDGTLRLGVRRGGPVELRHDVTRGDVLETLAGLRDFCL
jgi:hypothetical protein